MVASRKEIVDTLWRLYPEEAKDMMGDKEGNGKARKELVDSLESDIRNQFGCVPLSIQKRLDEATLTYREVSELSMVLGYITLEKLFDVLGISQEDRVTVEFPSETREKLMREDITESALIEFGDTSKEWGRREMLLGQLREKFGNLQPRMYDWLKLGTLSDLCLWSMRILDAKSAEEVFKKFPDYEDDEEYPDE